MVTPTLIQLHPYYLITNFSITDLTITGLKLEDSSKDLDYNENIVDCNISDIDDEININTIREQDDSDGKFKFFR